jgi:hypothetical protein
LVAGAGVDEEAEVLLGLGGGEKMFAGRGTEGLRR